ncbi:nucleoside-diphosphate kinase [Candidatus Kuenenbacteria bacterium]|nr:nucleoside-diphosphate kinase [Candidatus Kuenenbacteria bacterium]
MSPVVNRERTLVILKPDAVQRAMIGEVIKRFEQTGLKMTAIKIMMAKEEVLWEHYHKDDKWFLEKGTMLVGKMKDKGLTPEKEPIEYGKDIVRQLVEFMTAGPVVPMIFEGNQATAVVKKITGGTEPATSDVGTIRGDYTIDSYDLANLSGRAVRNLVHCSESPAEAEREIKLWFNETEMVGYNLAHDKILYDVNLDGIKE